MLDEVLRSVHQVDVNGNAASSSLYLGSDTRGLPGFFGSRYGNNDTSGMNNNSSNGIHVQKPMSTVRLLNSPPVNPVNNDEETVEQRLNVMEFLHFYKDIIERVEQAANEDRERQMNSVSMNQINPIIPSPSFNQYPRYIAPPEPQFQYFYPYPNQYPNQQPSQYTYPNQYPMENSYPPPFPPPHPSYTYTSHPPPYSHPSYPSLPPPPIPLPPRPLPVPPPRFPLPPPSFSVPPPTFGRFPYDNRMYRPPPPIYPRKRGGFANRKYFPRAASLSPISESVDTNDRWWVRESGYTPNPVQQFSYGLPGNAVVPEIAPSLFQQSSLPPPIENLCNNNEQLFHATEQAITDEIYLENSVFKEHTEIPTVRSREKIDTMCSSKYGESAPPFSSVAIVFLYGNKMFIGSIGDSR